MCFRCIDVEILNISYAFLLRHPVVFYGITNWYVNCLRHNCLVILTLNIPSLGRQRCLPSWGPRRTPCFFFVISQLFDAVDYSNYVFCVSETIIQ